MASMTSFLQKSLLDHLLNIASYSAPAALYVSLHTASPTDTGSHGSEVGSGVGYARQSIAGQMGATDATTGISVNTGTLTAGPASTSDWGTISYLGIEDSGTIGAGNMVLWGAASTTKLVTVGINFQLVPTQLAIQFD
jgi:hypothetical protein